MAYITAPKATDPEKDPTSPNYKNPRLTNSGPATLGGSSVVSTGDPSKPANTTPTKSGSFVNLQRYLDTNQPQAQQLGTNVAGSITKRGDEAKTAVNTAKDTFKGQVTANTPTFDESLYSQAVADPTKFSTSGDTTGWNKMLSGTYSGPTVSSATDLWNPASTAVNTAVNTGELVKTAGGQTELLRQIAPNPYSRGGMTMNQMLLQNVDPAREAITTSANALQPLKDVMDQTLTEAGGYVTQAQQDAANTRTDLINKVAGSGGALAGYQAQLEAKAEAVRQEDKNNLAIIDAIIEGRATVPMNDSVRRTLGRYGMTEAQLNEIANTNKQIQGYGQTDLKGIQGESYLPQDPRQYIKAGDVATTEDIARYRALNNLIGNQGKDIDLTKGTPVDAYNKAINDLNTQVSSWRSRVENAAKAIPGSTADLNSTLRGLGFTNKSSGGSPSFNSMEDAKNWTAPDGRSLYTLLSDPTFQKAANSLLGTAISAINPVAGLIYKAFQYFGDFNAAAKLAREVGLEMDSKADWIPAQAYSSYANGGTASGSSGYHISNLPGSPSTSSANWSPAQAYSSYSRGGTSSTWSPAQAYSSSSNGGTRSNSYSSPSSSSWSSGQSYSSPSNGGSYSSSDSDSGE